MTPKSFSQVADGASKIVGTLGLIFGGIFVLVQYFDLREREFRQRSFEMVKPILEDRLKVYEEAISLASKIANESDHDTLQKSEGFAKFKDLYWGRFAFATDKAASDSVGAFYQKALDFAEEHDPKKREQIRNELREASKEFSYVCRDSLSRVYVQGLGNSSELYDVFYSSVPAPAASGKGKRGFNPEVKQPHTPEGESTAKGAPQPR